MPDPPCKPPPAVSFVAPSGTGKTALLEQVIGELSRRGRRVGAVKHASHRFEIDHEGKDSWRLTRAGASPTVISAEGKLAVVQEGLAGEMPLGEILTRFMTGVDLVITEGYKTGHLPKIEVHRSGHGPELLCVTRDGKILDGSLIAVVSDGELHLPVPILPLDRPEQVCDFIEERFLDKRPPSSR